MCDIEDNTDAAAETSHTAKPSSPMDNCNNDQHIHNCSSGELDGFGGDDQLTQHDLMMSVVADLMSKTFAIDEQTHLFAQVAKIIENDSSTMDAKRVEVLTSETSDEECYKDEFSTCDADDEGDSESNDNASDDDVETREPFIKSRGLFGVHSGGKSFRTMGNNK